jgi:hypothetical protein
MNNNETPVAPVAPVAPVDRDHYWEGPMKGKKIWNGDSFHSIEGDEDWCVIFEDDEQWYVCNGEGEMIPLAKFLREADWSRIFRIAYEP